jgi:uncharacterized protein
MAKVPAAGRTKTRLARQTDTGTAVRFARHATAAVLQRLGGCAQWSTAVAVTPDCGVHLRLWPHGVRRQPQGSGDLGARMMRIFRCAAPGPVIIIGTDVPDITPSLIAHAFHALGAHDAVVGPATDGGYWLIGLKRRPRLPAPFANVRWSTPHALADTLANLQGYRVARVATLPDVDTAEDFARSAAVLGRRSPGPASAPP